MLPNSNIKQPVQSISAGSNTAQRILSFECSGALQGTVCEILHNKNSKIKTKNRKNNY